MILFFTDRRLNVVGQASTHLPKGLKIVDDMKTEDVDTGIAVLECTLSYSNITEEERELVSRCAAVGNYILRQTGDKEKVDEFYTIIESEEDTKSGEISIYAEDAGLDLLNEIVGSYEADKAYNIAHYIEKFAYDTGFEIGINEVASLTRQLSWDGTATITERLLSVATQFDGCEISFSFNLDGFKIKNKFINIYRERGKNLNDVVRLNKEVDSIVTTKSIANLATALRVTGGTPEQEEPAEGEEAVEPTPITLDGYTYDDGDFFLEGTYLKSRKAVEIWSRYLAESGDYTGHICKRFEYDTIDQAELCNRAIAELKKLREVEVNYEIDISRLPESAKLGDRINIVDDDGELYISARILKLEVSESQGLKKATLGEYLIKSGGISQKIMDLSEKFATSAQETVKALNAAKAAQKEAENAKQEAENASSVAGSADASASASAAAAELARQAAENAQTKASEAVSSATTAREKADAAQESAENASTIAEAVKIDVENAKKDIEAFEDSLTTIEETMSADYARKTELTEVSADLDAKITKNAAQITETVSRVTVIDETVNNAKSEAEKATTDAAAAQQAAADAEAKAQQAADDLTAAEQNLAALEGRADATEQEVAAAQQAVTQAQQAATEAQAAADAAQQAADKAQQDAGALAVRVTAAETELTRTAEEILLRATKTEVEGIEIGGRNLVVNSSLANNFEKWEVSSAEITEIDGVKCSHISGEFGVAKYVRQDVAGKIDCTDHEQQYVCSADVRVDNFVGGTTSPYLGIYFSGQYTTDDGTIAYANAATVSGDLLPAKHNGLGWVRMKWVVTFPYDFTILNFSAYARDVECDFYFKNLKIEKGNKATDWTPAPEDQDAATQEVATNLANNYYNKTQTEAKIKVEADRITSVVETVDEQGGRISTLEQTADGFSVRLGAVESDVDTAQSTANTAKADAATAQSTANTANSTANTAKSNAATAQTAANNAATAAATAQTTANNAAKTATNFLSYDSTNGLLVGNKSSGAWSGYRTQMLSDSFNILDASGNQLASYGANMIYLGKNSQDTEINFCNGLMTLKYDTEFDAATLKSETIRLFADGGYFSLYSENESSDGILSFRDIQAVENGLGLSAGTGDTYSVDTYSEIWLQKTGIGRWDSSDYIQITTPVFSVNGDVGVTGQISGPITSSLWIEGRDNALLRSTSTPSSASYLPLTSLKTTNGSWEMGTIDDRLYFSYATDANHESGENSTIKYYFAPEECRLSNVSGDFIVRADSRFIIQSYDNGYGSIYFGYASSNPVIYPGSNDKGYVGSSSYKWKAVYAVNGTIQTSDRNQKENILDLGEKYEELFKRLRPVTYKLKGKEHDRVHVGFIAQEVEEAMIEVGLTAYDFAALCIDNKVEYDAETGEERIVLDENGEPVKLYSLRYQELDALYAHMIQKLMQQVSALEEEIEKLKGDTA